MARVTVAYETAVPRGTREAAAVVSTTAVAVAAPLAQAAATPVAQSPVQPFTQVVRDPVKYQAYLEAARAIGPSTTPRAFTLSVAAKWNAKTRKSSMYFASTCTCTWCILRNSLEVAKARSVSKLRTFSTTHAYATACVCGCSLSPFR